MKKKRGISLMVWLMFLAISLYSFFDEGQSRSKLDCQKMALEYAKIFENLDYRALTKLTGREYSEEDEANFKKQFADPEVKQQLAMFLDMIRLFPKIGEIPDWSTEVSIEYEYIQGDLLIEMHGEFVFKGDKWVLEELEPRGGGTLDEDKKNEYASEISPAPPEGQKTIDAGLNELVAKLISAVKDKSWDGVKETGIHPGDCGLHPSDPPELREKCLKRLSQLPSISAIPAPAKSLRLWLKGNVDGKEAEVLIQFHWPDNSLKIEYVSFK